MSGPASRMDAEVEVLQNTLISRVKTLSSCIFEFLDVLRKNSMCVHTESLLKSVRNFQKQSTALVTQTLRSNKSRALAVNEIAQESRAELEALHVKYDQLTNSMKEQQIELNAASTELIGAQTRLAFQSSRASAIGSVLGSLLWKVSPSTDVISRLLTSDKMESFLELATTVLKSLEEIKSSASDETTFVNSLLGIFTNLLADSKGRHFIATTKQGNDLILEIVKVLALPDECLERRLKKILLTALCNLSINRDGCRILQNEENLFVCIAQMMSRGEVTEVEIMALRLTNLLTADLVDGEVALKIKRHVTKELLNFVQAAGDANARQLAAVISSNLSINL